MDIYKIIRDTGRLYGKAGKFIAEDIWQHNWQELMDAGKNAVAHLVKDTRVVVKTVRTFTEQKIGFQTAALSYFCTLAFVPFVAVCLAVTASIGLADKLTAIIESSTSASPEIMDIVIDAADNIISQAQSGLFGLISAILFVWLVIWMMMRVERVFNNVWKVEKPRRKTFLSLGVDIMIVIFAPFVIIIFFSGSIVYSHILDLLPGSFSVTDAVRSFLGWLIFCAIAIFTLSGMYKFIPATKVRYKCALKAALLAGIAFTALQYLYLETQVMVTRINTVYGTIAAIPLFMLWLRVGWLIIMLGAQVSYSFQKVEEELEEHLLGNKTIARQIEDGKGVKKAKSINAINKRQL